MRRRAVGAEYLGDGAAHVRVWAPDVRTAALVIQGGAETKLDRDAAGYFTATFTAEPGARYSFRLDGAERLLPDPASRFQPEGPHGPSELIAPANYEWGDQHWRGVQLDGQVVYEMHVGTFTQEGTWAAAERELAELAATGITLIEMMPVAEFDGEFGWGYDGVDLFAPTHLYGRPDELRRFVDTAHALGIGLILDVVYNHFGPSGNYLREFAAAYFTDEYENEWGDAINFDGQDAGPVREFFLDNARYWIDEFHFDGLRLDATQQIFDGSPRHIIAEIGEQVRTAAAGRSTLLIAENEPQHTRLVRPVSEGGFGLDALWNDDYHHSAMVALTGRAEAYYSDTLGDPQEFISAAKYGYLFQGQHYHWQRNPRGSSSRGVPPARFVVYLQNHDQVANSAHGLRGHLLTSPGRWRALTALTLLMPGTPMLFQGQEFSSSAPFLYFATFDATLNEAVRRGRAEFLTQFSSIRDYERAATLPDPSDPLTFARSKLDLHERERHATAYALHKDLLRLRRDDPAFSRQAPGAVDGAVLSSTAFVLRFLGEEPAADRLLFVNLGPTLTRCSFAEPLIAPPDGYDWELGWSSEDPRYGGGGTAELRPDGGWSLPGETAIVMRPHRADPVPPPRRRRTA